MKAGVAAAVVALGVAGAAGAQSAEMLWLNNCADCHGRRGEGGGAGTRSLLDDDWTTADDDRTLFDAIRHGLEPEGMPAFGQALTDRQAWALVVYIRELRERERRARTRAVGRPGQVVASQHHRYRVEPVVQQGVETPWAVDVLPDGRALITERSGPVRVLERGLLGEPIAGTPPVRDRGQGGMMDVAVHPDFAHTGWVYLAYAHARDDSRRAPGMTRIVRGRLVRESAGEGALPRYRWTDQHTVFEARPDHYLPSDIHFGCRIVFDPRVPGVLYFGIGERGHATHAQDLSRPNGKIHRLLDDGRIPPDNPFVGRAGVYESIWSYGHRNPQGLAFDAHGHLWETEHGPRGGDEVNLIEPGKNYGWPIVSFGIEYSGVPLRVPWPEPGQDIAMPVFVWTPSIGACGLDVVRGGAFERWAGDLVAGGLSGRNVDRLRIRDGRVVEREELLRDQGRVRDVVCALDGTIWVVLNAPDMIVRLVPAETDP